MDHPDYAGVGHHPVDNFAHRWDDKLFTQRATPNEVYDSFLALGAKVSGKLDTALADNTANLTIDPETGLDRRFLRIGPKVQLGLETLRVALRYAHHVRKDQVVLPYPHFLGSKGDPGPASELFTLSEKNFQLLFDKVSNCQ